MIYYSFDSNDNSLFTQDELFMNEAIVLAKQALEEDEVPIGAIIVAQDRIIAKAYNRTEKLNDVTAHAEMQAFTAAAHYIGGKYLKNCSLYVTVEPCSMCAGASYWSQIGRIVYGAPDVKRGFRTVSNAMLHPKTKLVGGVLQDECADLIQSFFLSKRK